MLDTVVIGQDDQTELHVQAAILGGRRQVDIRIWRRGPTGFAPSRSALTLDATDLDALQHGITELLEASAGGNQVARVVWDKNEGRRLRAETEPFGTRYVARLGFWQRVRDTWKPVGDGLVIGADRLKPLQDVLTTFKPRLDDSPPAPAEDEEETEPETHRRWPPPGADWLTVDRGRVAFHPRGVRITGSVEEEEDSTHRAVLCQWRREDSLWLPEEAILVLSIAELDRVLLALRSLLEIDEPAAGKQIARGDGSTLWVRIRPTEPQPLLDIDYLPPPGDNVEAGYERRLSMPASYLPKFGRMLAQCGALLIAQLSEEERSQLHTSQEMEAAEALEAAAAEAANGHDSESTVADLAVGSTGEMQAEPAAETDETDVTSEVPAAVEAETHEPADEPFPEPEPEPPCWIPIGEIELSRGPVSLHLLEDEQRLIALRWSDEAIQFPADHMEALLVNLRGLYYDALRGMRGRTVRIGDAPAVSMSIHNYGAAIAVALDQELDGRSTRLSFPVGEAPAFLDEAGRILAHI